MIATSRQGQVTGEAPGVLIVSDDGEFARTITGRWQAERSIPVFTLMSGDLCPGICPASFDLAIVGEVRAGILPSVLTILEACGQPAIFVASDRQAADTVRETHTRTLVIRQHEGWVDALMLVAAAVLRTVNALRRAEAAELLAARSEAQATLGRYVLEMRHSLNDALTSVLGNSELLLAQPGVLSAGAREQLETIRNMSLRMHEIFQRFSSLEIELRYAEKRPPQAPRSRAAAAGK